MHCGAWKEAFHTSFSYPSRETAKNSWCDALNNPNVMTLIAESSEVQAGFIASYDAEITDLYVIPEFRKQGIAALLVSALIVQFVDKTPPALWVAETNRGAINLYRILGFEETGDSKAESRRADGALLIRMQYGKSVQQKDRTDSAP